MTLKHIVFFITIACSCLLLASCNNDTDNNNKKEIKVALSAEVNPPYLYTNKHNEFVGLDMDYLKLLEKKITSI